MKTLHYSDLNPDCFVDHTELDEWIDYIGFTKPTTQVAIEWFPECDSGRLHAVILIREYLRFKRSAMIHRLAGRLTDALNDEHACDLIYAKIPQWAKW